MIRTTKVALLAMLVVTSCGTERTAGSPGRDEPILATPGRTPTTRATTESERIGGVARSADRGVAERRGSSRSGARADTAAPDAPVRHIAFTGGLDRDGGAFVVAEDGSGLTELLPGIDQASDPAWAPNGEHIAVVGHVLEPSESKLYLVRPDGSDKRAIGEGFQPAWSPDSQRIAITRYDSTTQSSDVAVIDRSGDVAVNLAASPLAETSPVWSPKGDEIAYVLNGSEIRIAPSAGGDTSRVTPRTILSIIAPAWSPDGSMLAFIAREPHLEGQWLYVVRRDGSGLRRLSKSAPANETIGWSPDGRSITFAHMAGDEGAGIGTIGADGKGFRALTPTGGRSGFFDANPRYSADGNSIAFVRSGPDDDSLKTEPWIMNASGTGLRRLAKVAFPVRALTWERSL